MKVKEIDEIMIEYGNLQSMLGGSIQRILKSGFSLARIEILDEDYGRLKQFIKDIKRQSQFNGEEKEKLNDRN